MSFKHKFNNIRNYQYLAFAVLIQESFLEESHKIQKKRYGVEEHVL